HSSPRMNGAPPLSPLSETPGEGTLSAAREESEIQRIHTALKKHSNNRLQAAAELGISRMGLYKKLHKYGLFEAGKAQPVSKTRLSAAPVTEYAGRGDELLRL